MKKTLLVLAAGMGSRFGGLKQIEPVGPNGEFIIDYSIFDAVRAGFNKVIFIIKEENFDVFKETIGKRVEGHVEVDYVFQNLDNVPSNFTIPSERVKPLGTAHAILCCKDKVEGQFAIINSDDFYGAEGYQDVANFMNNNHTDIGIVGYNAATELSPNGPVKRGVIINIGDEIHDLIESKLTLENDVIVARSLNTEEEVPVTQDSKVSMNLRAFPEGFMDYIEKKFTDFLEKQNLLTDEYLIPDVVRKFIKDGNKVHMIPTISVWKGITYREDKDELVKYIASLIDKGVYNKDSLWD